MSADERRTVQEPNLILSLARVLVAAAWADGKIEHEEINSLKDLLFRLPHLSEEAWQRLQMYIESPVDEPERRALLDHLARLIRTSEDKRLVLDALSRLIEADGSVTEDERAVFAEVREAVESVDTNLLGKLAKVFRPRLEKRTEIAATREAYFEDYIRNKVFFRVSQRAKEPGTTLELSEAEQRKLCLAGALMARVAHVDNEVKESEIQRIEQTLVERWKIGPGAAALVAEVAVSEVGANLDEFRATRRFFELTTREERILFVTSLFAIAAADEDPTYDEIEEIRQIANGLKLSHREFISAKVAVLD